MPNKIPESNEKVNDRDKTDYTLLKPGNNNKCTAIMCWLNKHTLKADSSKPEQSAGNNASDCTTMNATISCTADVTSVVLFEEPIENMSIITDCVAPDSPKSAAPLDHHMK